jgi:hypothetical protein
LTLADAWFYHPFMIPVSRPLRGTMGGRSRSARGLSVAPMRSRRLRALVALWSLLAWNSFDSEQVAGAIRDGAVHHETVVEAAGHAESSRGDHGHEESASQHEEHGPGHTHGTSSDHCTHQHGTAVPVRFNFGFWFGVTRDVFSAITTPSSLDRQISQRPPAIG